MSQPPNHYAEAPLIVGGLAPGAYSPVTLLVQCNSIQGVRWLRSAFLTMATGDDPGDLAESPVVALKGVSSLRLERVLESPRNHIRIHDGIGLHWTASAAEWVTMTDLRDPFLEGATGHQYLTNERNDDVLVEVSHGESHTGIDEPPSPGPSGRC